jgi:hypothetical protein
MSGRQAIPIPDNLAREPPAAEYEQIRLAVVRSFQRGAADRTRKRAADGASPHAGAALFAVYPQIYGMGIMH